VYLLYVKLKSDNWRCYYVGQAKDLEKRLLEHLSSDEPNSCVKNHVMKHTNQYQYAKVPKQNDREGIERYLYDELSPECNEMTPSGTPIPVNLP